MGPGGMPTPGGGPCCQAICGPAGPIGPIGPGGGGGPNAKAHRKRDAAALPSAPTIAPPTPAPTSADVECRRCGRSVATTGAGLETAPGSAAGVPIFGLVSVFSVVMQATVESELEVDLKKSIQSAWPQRRCRRCRQATRSGDGCGR